MGYNLTDIYNSDDLPDEGGWVEKLDNNLRATRWCLGFYHRPSFGYSTDVQDLVRSDEEGDEGFDTHHNHAVPLDATPGVGNLPLANSGFLQLPARGPGWVSNPGTPDSQRWGATNTISALIAIAREWRKRGHGDLVIGDISLKEGGPFRPHKSHQHGIDFDIRPASKDGYSGPLTWQSPKYSRELTEELITLIKNNGITKVKVIGFNDPYFVQKKETVHWGGHDNHMHVRFYP